MTDARASIHAMFPLDEAATTELDARLDAHRTEALAKAIGRLRAIPVDCTALTGPVWYGDGWNSAITCLEEIADYQTPDNEAYPGELQRLRALALGLRVAVLRKEDLAEARRLLVIHAEHEMNAREKAATAAPKAAPEFFEPGHAYTHRNGTDFRCVAVTTHPQTGEQLAMGWHIDSWDLHYPTTVGINQWNHEYDGVEAPVTPEADQ